MAAPRQHRSRTAPGGGKSCEYRDDAAKVTVRAKPRKEGLVISRNPNGFDVWLKSKSRKLPKRKVATLEIDAEPASSGQPSPVEASAFEPDARARAILRGKEISEADLRRNGGAYSLEQVQKLLGGVSRQSIEKRVREYSLLAVPGPSNRRRYPTIQFNGDGTVVQGLRDVLETLNFGSPWSALNFLVNADDRLDNARPIDLLRRGEIGLVVESARRMGEQGA